MMITMRDFIRDFISIIAERKCLWRDIRETLSHTPFRVMCEKVSVSPEMEDAFPEDIEPCGFSDAKGKTALNAHP